MVNGLFLVGRVVRKPEIREVSNGKNVCEITLALKRPFRNINNVYDTDYIKVTFWEYLAINVNEYCDKGCIIGGRGRLQVRKFSKEENKPDAIEVIGEQLMFITRAMPRDDKKDEEEVIIIPEDIAQEGKV